MGSGRESAWRPMESRRCGWNHRNSSYHPGIRSRNRFGNRPAPGGGRIGALAAAFTYAYYSYAARRLMLSGIPSRAAMGAEFGIGALLLLPVLLATGSPFLHSVQNAAVGLYMAVVPMFIGYICFGYGLERVRASTAIAISLLEPVVAALLAAAVLGERLSLPAYAGIALIFASLALFTFTGKKSG